MYIKTVKIQNFKCFEDFELNLNEDINIIVGNNEAGKSTLLEAIYLALTGVLDGKYLKNEINPYIFNKQVVKKYYSNKNLNYNYMELPEIIIELYFEVGKDEDKEFKEMRGNNNIKSVDEFGIQFKILFNEDYQEEYKEFCDSYSCNSNELEVLPVEFYKIETKSFARHNLTRKKIPIKSVLIDSSINKSKNGSDIYLSYIIDKSISNEEKIQILNAHREMKYTFSNDKNIKNINDRIFQDKYNISEKELKLSVDLLHNDWKNTLLTYIDDIPFQYIGKGEQCYIKTNLALLDNKAQDASLILLEEPESHLSHSKLNSLLEKIKYNVNNVANKNKQIIITTHSSFVANKMLLKNIIMINDGDSIHFTDLQEKTFNFFEKVSGYDTLRLVLSKKTVLVEGASDELIFQRAYKDKYGKLPIEDEIDVISVGTSFLRYLELAEKLNNKVIVVTDNDGNVQQLENKYKEYKNNNNIKICYEKKENTFDDLDIKISDDKNNKNNIININTLEPNLLKYNNIDLFNKIFKTNCKNNISLLNYMLNNKVECALKIFEYHDAIEYPEYIKEAVNECE
jgi:putative ATP-dependent endonuclease of OLD family